MGNFGLGLVGIQLRGSGRRGWNAVGWVIKGFDLFKDGAARLGEGG